MNKINCKNKPLILCILDGFGLSEQIKNNAIFLAKKPFIEYLFKHYPHSQLLTSGTAIGLPVGQMGNSEVGHLTIGSGRIIKHDLVRINEYIKEDKLSRNKKLLALIAKLKYTKGCCHLLGLLSDGGVHSHFDHFVALIKILINHSIKVKIHAFLDGRDTNICSAELYISKLANLFAVNELVEIASISGRYYAMDRDQRWDRTSLAYWAIRQAKTTQKFLDPCNIIKENYNNNIFDEFIKPATNLNYQGIKPQDAILMANFRADRVIQLLDSLINPNFQEFAIKPIKLSYNLGLVKYSQKFDCLIEEIFPKIEIDNCLAEIVAKNNLRQLRLAETEKFAHVTFFFNGGQEKSFINEDRLLIPSPKVKTYDLEPAMSAIKVTKSLIDAINSQEYELIIVNYANCDMVGHTGNLSAAIKAVEVIDDCLKKIVDTVLKQQATILITADHGNIEQMYDNNSVNTTHTTNPVPCILVANKLSNIKLNNGLLSDIAPTILDLLGIKQPNEMTGRSLINKI